MLQRETVLSARSHSHLLAKQSRLDEEGQKLDKLKGTMQDHETQLVSSKAEAAAIAQGLRWQIMGLFVSILTNAMDRLRIKISNTAYQKAVEAFNDLIQDQLSDEGIAADERLKDFKVIGEDKLATPDGIINFKDVEVIKKLMNEVQRLVLVIRQTSFSSSQHSFQMSITLANCSTRGRSLQQSLHHSLTHQLLAGLIKDLNWSDDTV